MKEFSGLALTMENLQYPIDNKLAGVLNETHFLERVHRCMISLKSNVSKTFKVLTKSKKEHRERSLGVRTNDCRYDIFNILSPASTLTKSYFRNHLQLSSMS